MFVFIPLTLFVVHGMQAVVCVLTYSPLLIISVTLFHVDDTNIIFRINVTVSHKYPEVTILITTIWMLIRRFGYHW